MVSVFGPRDGHARCSVVRSGFGDHLDRVTGTLLETDGAAGATIVVEAVAAAGPELDDRLLWAGGIALVALEAIAAGETAPRFVARFGFAQAGVISANPSFDTSPPRAVRFALRAARRHRSAD